MKKITKIVLTGGPCAGKTSALSYLKENLIKNGYGAVIVSETSTELFSSGISPSKMPSLLDFQQTQLDIQIAKEYHYENACKKFKNFDNIVMICDRGITDAKVYLGDEGYKTLLENNNLTENDIFARYDAVFKLTSTANGAEKYYTLENNSVRKESIEEARMLDDKITIVWQQHPNFKEINNSTGFSQKLESLLNEILNFLNAQ